MATTTTKNMVSGEPPSVLLQAMVSVSVDTVPRVSMAARFSFDFETIQESPTLTRWNFNLAENLVSTPGQISGGGLVPKIRS